jgi:hypothetical protein
VEISDRLTGAEDPSIAYRARLLLRGEEPDSRKLRSLRERIRTSANVQRLLSHRQDDGRIQTNPYQKWQGPHWTLYSLALIAYPPGDKLLVPLRDQVYDWLFAPEHLEFPRSLVISGQEERPRRCASQEGNAIYYSLVLGLVDDRTHALVDRLIAFQWPDGGWNCDKRPEAHVSSFVETLIPLRALWHYGQTYNHKEAVAAADRAAGFLLERRLLYRVRDGALIHPTWGGKFTEIHYPIQFYDLLFVLQVMAEIGKIGDSRCDQALDLLSSKQLQDGGFPLEVKNCRRADTITTRGSFADWGPAGTKRSNPFVSIAALWVLAKAKRVDIRPGAV